MIHIFLHSPLAIFSLLLAIVMIVASYIPEDKDEDDWTYEPLPDNNPEI